MSRYFFHIRNAWRLIPDDEGMELPSFEAARMEAYASSDDLARAAIRDGSNSSATAIEIADETGNILGMVRVSEQKRLA